MDTWTAKMAALKIVAVATALTVLGPAAGGRADTIQTGYLFASDYGRSELDRFQYTYNQTTNKMTGITPYGSGGSTSSAYFLGGGQFPVKEGLQGTGNDLIIVGGVHGQHCECQRPQGRDQRVFLDCALHATLTFTAWSAQLVLL